MAEDVRRLNHRHLRRGERRQCRLTSRWCNQPLSGSPCNSGAGAPAFTAFYSEQLQHNARRYVAKHSYFREPACYLTTFEALL